MSYELWEINPCLVFSRVIEHSCFTHSKWSLRCCTLLSQPSDADQDGQEVLVVQALRLLLALDTPFSSSSEH